MFVCGGFLPSALSQEFSFPGGAPSAQESPSASESPSTSEASSSKEDPSPQPDTRSSGTFSISSKSPSDNTSTYGSPFSKLQPAEHPNQFTKRDPDFEKSLHTITDEAIKSVVRLEGSDNKYILGTLVSTNGMIVSKYSDAKKMQRCVFSDGETWPFRIVNFDQKKDLCLIRVNRNGLTPIKFRSDLNHQQQVGARRQAFHSVSLIPPSSGTLALSVGHNQKVTAFGMVTMGLHNFKIAQPECPDCIDMGITVSPYPSLTRINGIVYPNRRGIKVLRVYPRSAGESLGLLVDDLIHAVNGVGISERTVLDQETQKIHAGDVMTMKIFRNGRLRELTYKIPAVKKTLHDRWGGGPYSDRRFGFGPVIVHDSVLDPQDCGGPLIDVNGHVIGLNIARSMRVASFAINIEDVYMFVRTHSPKTKMLFRD